MSVHPLDPLVQTAAQWWADRLDHVSALDQAMGAEPPRITDGQRRQFAVELALQIGSAYDARCADYNDMLDNARARGLLTLWIGREAEVPAVEKALVAARIRRHSLPFARMSIAYDLVVLHDEDTANGVVIYDLRPGTLLDGDLFS